MKQRCMRATRRGRRVTATLIAAGLAAGAQAGFFIPKDSTMVMGMYSPTESMFELSHGVTRDTSVAIGVGSMADALRTYRWNVAHAQAAKLVGRVYNEDGIGNAYVFAGPLMATADTVAKYGKTFNGTRFGVHGGVWADYETRRIYGRVSWHGYKNSAFAWNEVVAQAMLAPYLADYEDVASWGGVQVKRRTGETQMELTPFVRFFKKDWWIDAGVSVNRANRKDIFVNVMHLF
jgi:hypothetical protein